MFKTLKRWAVRLALPAALAGALLVPATASASYGWGCPGIPWSSGGAPQAYTCSDSAFTGGLAYAISHVVYGGGAYAVQIQANSIGGVPFRLYLYDANTTTVYGPWLVSNGNAFQVSFPNATQNHPVYPLLSNNSSDANNPNHLAKNYNGWFLGCDLITTCTQ